MERVTAVAVLSRIMLYGIVALALLVGALYVVVEQTEYWREPVIRALAQRTQADVEVKAIDARLSAYDMKIDLREVTLRAADAHEATEIGRMVIDVNLWRSLLRGDWVASVVSIFDTQWHVTTDAAGSIHVSNPLLTQEGEGTTVLVDTAITWATPEGKKTLPPALIAVKTAGGTTAFDVRVQESPQRSDAIRLSGEFAFAENAMSGANGNQSAGEAPWRVRAYFEAQVFDLGVWRARLPFIKLNGGVLSAKLDIERGFDGAVRVGGDARVENYPLWDQPHTMDGHVQARWSATETSVAVSNLAWDSAAATWQNARVRAWDDSSGRLRVSIQAPQAARQALNFGDLSATLFRASLDARGQLRQTEWGEEPAFDDIDEMRIRLSGETLQLAYHDARERFASVDAVVAWTTEADGNKTHIGELSMTRDGARYQSTGRVVFDGEKGRAQVSAFVEELDVGRFQDWLNARGGEDAAWLRERLRQGVFRDASLRMAAPIHNGRIGALSFASRGRITASEWMWPIRDDALSLTQVDADFELSDGGFSTTIHRALVNGLTAEARYEARRANTPKTEMTATIVGEIDAMMAAMRSARASQTIDAARGFAFFGPARLVVSAVSTQSELSADDIRGELIVDGVRAELARSTPHVAVNDLSGRVRFAAQGIESGDLQGQVGSAPVRIDIKRQRDAVVARAVSTIDLLNWLDTVGALDGAVASSARSIIRGAARWEGEWRDSPSGASFGLTSNLQGVEVRLPAPFDLREEETRGFTLQSVAGIYRVCYGAGERMLSGRVAGRKGAWVGGLRIGQGKVIVDDEKMMVRGRVASPLHLAEWLPFLIEDSADATPQPSPRQASQWDVDLEFAKVSVFDQVIREADLRLVSDENNLFMSVASTPLQGILLKQRKTNVSLEHLYIPQIAADGEKDAPERIRPVDIPAFNLTVRHLVLGETPLRDFSTEIKPIDEGVSITGMRFMTTANTVNLSGLWTLNGDATESRFTFEMMSDNFGRFLQDNDLLENLEGGAGSASGELAWQGAPWNFDLEHASGGVLINLKEGQLKHTELGVGRLVGLFNTAAVVRRINLDFKDVFAQGLSFDTMRGSFQLRDQNVHISGLEIDGLSTNIRIKGRTGLVARDYDQRMRVVVKLREGLPVVGALVGGPLAAIGVYLVDQVTNVSGMLDQVATLEYRITGSWEAPVIEFVRARALDAVDQRLRNLGRTKDASDKANDEF